MTRNEFAAYLIERLTSMDSKSIDYFMESIHQLKRLKDPSARTGVEPNEEIWTNRVTHLLFPEAMQNGVAWNNEVPAHPPREGDYIGPNGYDAWLSNWRGMCADHGPVREAPCKP